MRMIISTETFVSHLWRHVGLVVSTLDSRSGVAGSSPDDGTTHTHQCGTFLKKVLAHMSTKPFIPVGSINWYRLRLWVEVLSAATGTSVG
jgi:hypothetical protein